MKKIAIKILSVVLFFLLSLPVLANLTLAQTNSELRLTSSPLPINLKVEPGSSITTDIKIKNDGLNTENIKVTLMKFKADPTTGAPLLMEREAGDNYFDWVSFSENQFQLPGNEWKTITATVNVPATAAFGYYYAIVFSRADQPIPIDGQRAMLTGGMATLVLLEAQVPNAKREVQVADFSVDKQMFEFLPATFSVKPRNSGNVPLIPRGNIFVTKDDETLANLDINPSIGSILPDSPRNFSPEWSDGFPYYVTKTQDGQTVLDDQGQPVQELKWDFSQVSKLRLGKYTAKLFLVYDDGQRDVPIEAAVSFWVVPWRLIIGLLLVVILVLIGLKSTLQNWYKKIRNLFGKQD